MRKESVRAHGAALFVGVLTATTAAQSTQERSSTLASAPVTPTSTTSANPPNSTQEPPVLPTYPLPANVTVRRHTVIGDSKSGSAPNGQAPIHTKALYNGYNSSQSLI